MIYTPNVPIFRAEHTSKLLEAPWLLSIITAAAPNAGCARNYKISEEDIQKCFIERAERVLQVAIKNGHDSIILGAWGCGVFKNDSKAVSKIFKDLLETKFKGCFKRIIFAIKG
jgi:uncharacterized protein (TIGR02452 family)